VRQRDAASLPRCLATFAVAKTNAAEMPRLRWRMRVQWCKSLLYVTGENRMQKQITVIIEREGDGYVSLCPELDIASQGDSVEEARENLREAIELFYETASPQEIESRFHEEVYVTQMEVAVG
jgi:predicted RNase H-like HicB family nuclease